MKTVELEEIKKLYTTCHVRTVENQSIRTCLNTGNMSNKLNCDYSFMNRNSISAIMQNISTQKKS